MSKAKQLRNLLNNPGLIMVAGAHDGISAKIAENKGFNAIWASGLGISASATVPDESILTMTEFLQAAVIMNESTNIPVIADCDSGFGSVNNVIHMVKKYESMGIAGICIEDKVFPKKNSFDAREQKMVTTEEFCSKIYAAKASQKSKDFVVIARTEALIAGLDMDEALSRANKYVEAGADAILIHSRSNKADEILEFTSKWTNGVPIVVVPTKYPSITTEVLKEVGIKMSIYANQALRASIRNMEMVLQQIIEDGSSKSVEDKISTIEEVFNLQNVNEMKVLENKYTFRKEKVIN
ncbi:phosphoenolpyruvate mutase [Bacillus safensis]|uniref:phosphoenolpyruvate mutase n=1 Tax=Bacillus safensis TaxID=561879 RepID=UPI001BAA2B6B|nr:phosphoenolpyruvate mutase [Bacillus safensis]MBR0607487.1 phosphoenolpyruvate mutase [Bacillus safensis]WJE39817.1 phosphoenolpyruvate mutase [Bacillus safensis]